MAVNKEICKMSEWWFEGERGEKRVLNGLFGSEIDTREADSSFR